MLLLAPQHVREANDVPGLESPVELGELHCEGKQPLILAQTVRHGQFTRSTGLRIEKLVEQLAGLSFHNVQTAQEVPSRSDTAGLNQFKGRERWHGILEQVPCCLGRLVGAIPR